LQIYRMVTRDSDLNLLHERFTSPDIFAADSCCMFYRLIDGRLFLGFKLFCADWFLLNCLDSCAAL